MAYELLTEYNLTIDPDADSGGCWAVFGFRTGSTGPFSAPVDLEINNVAGTYSVGDILPGGDNPSVTAWSQGQGEYAFTYGGCTDDCNDTAFVIVDVNDCCAGTLTINLNVCTLELVGGLPCGVPTLIEVQEFDGLTWNVVATGIPYAVVSDNPHRLVVGCPDGCIYISNTVQGSCAGAACAINVTLTILPNDDLRATWTGGVGNYDVFFDYAQNNLSNTCNGCTGWSNEASTLGTALTTLDHTPLQSDTCYRVVVKDNGIAGSCIDVDCVYVPLVITTECDYCIDVTNYGIPSPTLTQIDDISVTVGGSTFDLSGEAEFSFPYCIFDQPVPVGGPFCDGGASDMTLLDNHMTTWLVNNGYSGTAYEIQTCPGSVCDDDPDCRNLIFFVEGTEVVFNDMDIKYSTETGGGATILTTTVNFTQSNCT